MAACSRGLSQAESRSTARFAATIVAATINTMVCTTARSRSRTDSTNNRPTPGQAKTLSVTIAHVYVAKHRIAKLIRKEVAAIEAQESLKR